MSTQQSLEEIILAVEHFLVSNEMSPVTLSNYRNLGLAYFRTAFHDAQMTTYSETFAVSLVMDYYQLVQNNQAAKRSFRTIRRVYELMQEYVQTGTILYHGLPWWKYKELSSAFETALLEYLGSLKKAGYSELTIRSDRSTIRTFLLYIESIGKVSLAMICADDIEKYLPILMENNPAGISNSLCALRRFLQMLFETKLTSQNLSIVLQTNAAKKKRIKQGFNSAEIQALLSCVDRSAPLGKRNYAMMLLAIRTGLRQIDVLNLKLQDIHWEEAEVRIIQRKTNRQLILPIDQETGDAIADYILHGRPASESTFVFLRTVAPYTNLKVGSCIGSRIVQKYAALAGVQWNVTERKGFHSFRRSLGRNLLENDTPLHTIKEILGHANSNSTRQYLAIDLQHLRECALSLDGIVCTKEVYQ